MRPAVKPTGLLCIAAVGIMMSGHPLGIAAAQDAENRVLELDGRDSYVELPPNAFTSLTAATVEGWIKFDRLGSYRRFFDSGRAFQTLVISQGSDPGELDFDVWLGPGGNHRLIHVANVVRTNTWFHIAAVTGPGGMKLYVNGVLAGADPFEGSFAAVANGDQVRLGRDCWHGGDYTQGQIDEVRVWRVARTQAEIQEHMFQRLTGQEPNLAALWNFDDGTAKDSSPARHDGQLRGHATVGPARLPAAAEVERPAIAQVSVIDPLGRPVRNAELRLEQEDALVAMSRPIGGGAKLRAGILSPCSHRAGSMSFQLKRATWAHGQGKCSCTRVKLRISIWP